MVAMLSNAEFRGLIRFPNLAQFVNIPAGSQLVEATLVLTFRVYVGNHELTVKYLKPGPAGAWDATTCCASMVLDCDTCRSGAGVLGWAYRAPNVHWTAPGALNDTIPGVQTLVDGFTFPVNSADALLPRDIPLDLSVVSNWLVNASTNNGVIVQLTKLPPNANLAVASVSSGFVSGLTTNPMYVPFRPAVQPC